MEHDNKSPDDGASLPAVVDDAPQPPTPGLCASNKRAFELAFPQPSLYPDCKRTCSQSCPSTPSQHKNFNHVQNGDDVSADVDDSPTIPSESFEMELARHQLLLDPALVNQTLVTNVGGDAVAINHSCQVDPSEAEISLDRSHIQETSAAESNTVESNEALATRKETLSSLNESRALVSKAFASCNKERPLGAAESPLERSRNEIRKCLEDIKQNTPSGVIDQDTTTILVNEIVEIMNLALPEEANKIRSSFFSSESEPIHPVKIETEQIPSQHTNLSPSGMLSLHDYIGDSTSPLSPSIFSPRIEFAAPCTASSVKHDVSTQTEPMAIVTSITGTGSHTSHQLGLGDTELWQRELESIRRLKPLANGAYTKVNVPLRETVKTYTSSGVKNKHNSNVRLKSLRRRSQCPSAETNLNIKPENCDVVYLSDTDEENRELRTNNSCRVGGGDPGDDWLYGPISDEEERPIRGQHSLYKGPSDGKSGAIMEFSDDGESDIQESIDKKAAISSNRPMVSTGRYDGNDSIDEYDNNAYYANTHNGQNTLNHNDAIIVNGREDSGLKYKPAVAPNRISYIQRGRSRSPVYQRRRSRTDRHYSPRYSSEKYAVQVRCHNAERHYASPNTWRQRYIRDEPEHLTFYGYTTTKKPSREVERALRYQDRLNDVGEIPGPQSGLRFKLDNYIRDIRSDAVGLEQKIKSVIQETFYAYESIDEEQALQRSWADQPMNIYKGFPLVEDVGFVSVRNHTSPDGDCYWRALAYILHGKPTRWDIIKADHLAYIQHVLSDKTHPRHQLYAQLNAQFFETHGGLVSSNGCAAITAAFKANVWQLLHLPQSWTPGVMQQITADLYNIYLVTFTYDQLKNMCSEVSIRGVYNSRHVFMLYTNNNHFQPLTVNEYLS
ncbi:hypothetical protein F5B22DRAFT_386512 [Xylaria bambusicola]|uniref:uncharacterized protein n=1 Tax=Xylaria bambusicola TaxID=326684 RepID=UPI002008D70F|nr:uncharacterized protein F5B22DRAFT_386512 [Xylaria bambusicola]KAI0508661.1 hypothetical protein F5B22DRAFT_386512 [Xylaria bambusicola]